MKDFKCGQLSSSTESSKSRSVRKEKETGYARQQLSTRDAKTIRVCLKDGRKEMVELMRMGRKN